jgi:DNA mismatch repair ATPase MutS
MKVNVPEEPTGSVEQPAVAGSAEQPASAGSFEYLYKIEEGINEVDGGVEVLRQMQYPTEILDKLSH